MRVPGLIADWHSRSLVAVASAQAGQSISLILNWTPAADHSPFYYAKSQGWYEKAGIDLSIEVGKGSGVSSLKVGSGGAPFGISDLATMLVARSKGADAVALMSIYANTGQTFYWLEELWRERRRRILPAARSAIRRAMPRA